eukprot:Hpha_TRINITY_DN13422_c0_g1::TRINITY_DN13422_c0_g1_i8::g.131349::m.131349
MESLKHDPGFVRLEKLIRELDSLYSMSNRAWRGLVSIAAKEGKKCLRPAQGYRIRWLPKWYKAYARARRMWDLWIAHMQTRWSSKKKFTKKQKTSVLKRLRNTKIQEQRDYLFSVLRAMKSLSLALQEDNLSCVLAEAALGQAVRTLETLSESELVNNIVKALHELKTSLFEGDGWLAHIKAVLDVFATDWRTSSLSSFTEIAKRMGISEEHVPSAEARWRWVTDLVGKYKLEGLNLNVWTEVLAKLSLTPDVPSQICTAVVELCIAGSCWSSVIVERDFAVFRHKVGQSRKQLSCVGLGQEDFICSHGPHPTDEEGVREFLSRGGRVWHG